MPVAEQLQGSGDENPLVPLALGLRAVLAAAARALAVDETGAPLPPPRGAPALAPLRDDDPLVLAALGILSVRRSVERWTAVACSATADVGPTGAPEEARAAGAPPPRGLLR